MLSKRHGCLFNLWFFLVIWLLTPERAQGVHSGRCVPSPASRRTPFLGLEIVQDVSCVTALSRPWRECILMFGSVWCLALLSALRTRASQSQVIHGETFSGSHGNLPTAQVLIAGMRKRIPIQIRIVGFCSFGRGRCGAYSLKESDVVVVVGIFVIGWDE